MQPVASSPPQVFIAHSKDDKEGELFFTKLLGAAGLKQYWYPYTEGVLPPHAPGIRKAIDASAAVFVLLSKGMEQGHTRPWIGFEVGVGFALKRPVWVFEPVGESIAVPVPFATGYVQRVEALTTARTFPYTDVVQSVLTGEIVVDPNSTVLFLAKCMEADCSATFLAHVLNPTTARCPVCRRPGTIGRLSQANGLLGVKLTEWTW